MRVIQGDQLVAISVEQQEALRLEHEERRALGVCSACGAPCRGSLCPSCDQAHAVEQGNAETPQYNTVSLAEARRLADEAHARLREARRAFLTCPADDTQSAAYLAVQAAQADYSEAREAESDAAMAAARSSR